MNTFLQDVRYGIRVLMKSPGFTLVAALTLALGIGANTSVFSVINAALIQPLPVRDPQRLAIVGDPWRVHSNSTGGPRTDLLSEPLYRELVKTQDAFAGLAATGYFGPSPMVAIGNQAPQKAQARIVSENFFSVLGVDAALGRVFRAEDEHGPGSDPVVVVSHAFWRDHLGQDPRAVGSVLRVNGYPMTIVGITPAGFTGEVVGDSIGLWVPLQMQGQVMPGDARLNNVLESWLILIGRLKDGVNVAQAQAQMNVAFQRVATSSFQAKFPDPRDVKSLQSGSLEVFAGEKGLSGFRRQFSQPLWLLMAMVGLVLLIACVNVANLMLARSAARRKEIAVRLAIGATGGRIVRQLLTESLLLALLGGAIGLLLAQWGTRLLLGSVRPGGAVPLETSPDPLILAFTFAVCLLTGVLFGLAPALRSRRVELTESLNSTTRGDVSAGSRWSTGRVLVAAQVALSVVVMFSAGVLVHSLRNLGRVDTGYERAHLLLLRLDPRMAGYKGESYITFCNQLLDRLRSLPGVTAATFSDNGLYSGSESGYSILVPGVATPTPADRTVAGDSVGPNYFTAIGIPLLMGRDIGPQDVGGKFAKSVVINESMAKFYFHDGNPIGRTIQVNDLEHEGQFMQVVGVARDVRDHDLRDAIPRRLYMPMSSDELPGEPSFEIRTAGDPAALEPAVRQAVAAANSQLNVLGLETHNELVNNSMRDQIFMARLSGFFAGLALLLACIGLYGITSYAVAGRTREIGVRMALGAEPRAVVWLVLREGLLLVSAGLLFGVPAAFASQRLLGTMVFGVGPLDPAALGISLGMLGMVALAAAYVPARRAARVDPMVALRYE